MIKKCYCCGCRITVDPATKRGYTHHVGRKRGVGYKLPATATAAWDPVTCQVELTYVCYHCTRTAVEMLKEATS